MIGRRTFWVAAAVIGAAAAAMFWQPLASLGKPGVVTDNDNVTYIGDVSESGGKLTVTDDSGSGIEIQKANVKTTKYFESPQEEYAARMGLLPPTDVKGRIAVAKWAVKQKQPELAKQALDSAIKIEPNNGEALALRKTVEQSMPAQPPATVDPANPANPPATAPATVGGKMRLVTPTEINRIRQIEWQPSDDTVRVRVEKEAKDAFIARSRDLTPQVFNKMTPVEQARVMIKGGTDKMKAGVHILNDPLPVANYKKNVQKMILTGCAAGGCHDATSKTNFVLYTDPTDEATYTNYLVLQSYKAKVGDRVRMMVDRDQPDESLLSEFALAPKAAITPHPELPAPGYTGLFRGVQDPRFKLLSQWLKATPTIAPSYGVDLTKPPEEEEKPADGAAAEKGAAPEKGVAPEKAPAKGAAPSVAPQKGAAPAPAGA